MAVYEVTLLWCPEQSRRHSIVSISSLESFPSARDLPTPRAPPEVAGPPPAMPETVAPPAAAITEALPAARPKPAANTAHKRQISEAISRNERPIPHQARPKLAEGDAREDRQGCQTHWPYAQAQIAQLKVVICDQIVVASSQPRPWQSFI